MMMMFLGLHIGIPTALQLRDDVRLGCVEVTRFAKIVLQIVELPPSGAGRPMPGYSCRRCPWQVENSGSAD